MDEWLLYMIKPPVWVYMACIVLRDEQIRQGSGKHGIELRARVV